MTPESISPNACPSCGARQWRALPALAPQAMASDGRLVRQHLAKMDCATCGAVRSVTMPSIEQLAALFSVDYTLYAHPAGQQVEADRQKQYAAWILQILAGRKPDSVFEVGSGNGSLLQELSQRMPGTRLSGLEPASSAAAYARQAGLDVSEGFLTDAAVDGVKAQLVLAINVMEHVQDPRVFLATLRQAMQPDGFGIVICPDGDQPSTELLIYDHLHSYSRRAMHHLFRQAGLAVQAISAAPAGLGAFQAVLFTRDAAELSAPAETSDLSPARLHQLRHDYLHQWQVLQAALLERLAGDRKLACFGTGETAALLAAYAPGIWQQVDHCLVDQVADDRFCGKPVTLYRRPPAETAAMILLGSRPASQPYLAKRLTADGYSVLRWDDLISA